MKEKPCLFNAVGNPNGLGECKAVCVVCGADGGANCKNTENDNNIAVNSKVQFYALYLYRTCGGKYVLTTEHLNDIWKNNLNDPIDLKSVDDITDEDLNKFMDLFNEHLVGRNSIRKTIKEQRDSLFSCYIDALRLLGYALDWNGITVKEQIERGWVRIMSNQIEK